MSRFILPFQSVWDKNGNPLVGAKLYFYETGTSTAKDTYTDEALTTPNSNPVIASANGEFGNIFLNGSYRVELKDKNNVMQPGYPADSVPGQAGETVLDNPALKLIEGRSNQRIVLLGYAAIRDGGGGEYYWNASSTAADDAGTVVQATGVATGRWLRLYSGELNLEWFGPGVTGTLTTAITTIGSDNVTLNIKQAAYMTDGVTNTIPATLSVNIHKGGSLNRVSGGTTTTTLIFNGSIKAAKSAFDSNLTITITGPFQYDGPVSDLTGITITDPLTSANAIKTFGSVDFITGTGNRFNIRPLSDNNPLEINFYLERDGSQKLGAISGHGPYGTAGTVGNTSHQSWYTKSSSASLFKRLDIEAGQNRSDVVWSNIDAFSILGTGLYAQFFVGLPYPTVDDATNSVDSTTQTLYNAICVFRNDIIGAADLLILENRNGANSDAVTLGFAFEDSGGVEILGAEIKTTITDVTAGSVDAKFQVWTRTAGSLVNPITMIGNDVIIKSGAVVNGSSLTVGNKNTTEFSDPTIVAAASDNAMHFIVYNATGIAWSVANTCMRVAKNSTTSRSINAAGTVNASGADYAEYMEKSGDFTINKGDICGIDKNGKLTNIFEDAITFVIKSTNPSYVGNDTWGLESTLNAVEPVKPKIEEIEYTGMNNPGAEPSLIETLPEYHENEGVEDYHLEHHKKEQEKHDEIVKIWRAEKDLYKTEYDLFLAKCKANKDKHSNESLPKYKVDKVKFDTLLEASRQKVDRIAFSGQVPVNIISPVVGCYVIPKLDGIYIKGICVEKPTFDEYLSSIGKVIKVSDSIATIIVKIT